MTKWPANDMKGSSCVFAGATNGIGLATLRKMLTMLPSSTCYVLGRSATTFADEPENLRRLAPSSSIVFIERKVSPISDIDATCNEIAAAESKVSTTSV